LHPVWLENSRQHRRALFRPTSPKKGDDEELEEDDDIEVINRILLELKILAFCRIMRFQTSFESGTSLVTGLDVADDWSDDEHASFLLKIFASMSRSTLQLKSHIRHSLEIANVHSHVVWMP
jgi:uncharacterized protein YciU (UPF0263 family)